MRLQDLYETPADVSTITLYRGDTSKIDQFDISKTDVNALFGAGIYLTSDATVARDYSFARTHDVQAHIPSDVVESKRELIADYLQEIIRTELEWPKIRDGIQQPFRDRAWQIDREAEDRDAQVEALRSEMTKATVDGYKKVLQQAKALYKQRSGDFVFTKNTMGQWKMLKKEWKGVITHFDIPTAYASCCLHGDRPLTDKAIAMMRQVIMDMTGEGKRFYMKGMIDFRDDDNNGTTFDKWVALFKKGGARISFGGGEVAGGTGKNPSLENIMNGTLSGYYIRNDAGDALIAGFRNLGYVGIEYDGGIRVGNHVRGGGGIEHRAFVFWDDRYINSCIVAAKDAEPEANEGDPLKGITPMAMYKNFRTKK